MGPMMRQGIRTNGVDGGRTATPAGGGTVETPSDERTGDKNGRLRGTAVVANPQGLHMRPASAFARLAQQFSCSVTVWNGAQSYNGKSLLDLMMLGAEPGTELVVEVHGQDADAALPALLEILAAPSADDVPPEPGNPAG